VKRKSQETTNNLKNCLVAGMLPWQPGGIKFTQCVSDQKSAFSPLQKKNYALDRKMKKAF